MLLIAVHGPIRALVTASIILQPLLYASMVHTSTSRGLARAARLSAVELCPSVAIAADLIPIQIRIIREVLFVRNTVVAVYVRIFSIVNAFHVLVRVC